MMVTDHFSTGEFASRDGAIYPTIWVYSRLKPLCQQLEVIRSAIDRPLIIISGYRSPEHNAAVNGAKNSQHTFGRAADVRVADMNAGMLHGKIMELYRQGAIKLGGCGKYLTWVHVDIRQGDHLAQWVGPGLDKAA